MIASIGSIIAYLGLDVSGMLDGSRKARGVLGGLESSMTKAAGVAGTLTGVITGLGSTMVAVFVKKGMESIDANTKLAQSIGATTASVQTLNAFMEDNGVAQGQWTAAAKKLNITLGEAANGNEKAAQSFSQLGLDVNKLINMDADARFAEIADAVTKLGSDQEIAAAASDLFGKRIGTDMVVALKAGGDALREQRSELESYGALVSDIDAASVERAGDAMARFGMVIEAVSNRITVKLAPYLEVLSERFKTAAKDTHGFQSAIDVAFEAVLNGAGFVGDAIRGLQVVFKGLEVFALSLSGAVVSAFELIATGVAYVLDQVTSDINLVIDGLNKLPGVDIERLFMPGDSAFMERLHEIGDASRQVIVETQQEMHDLAMQPLPSEGIKQYLADVQEAARQTSEAVVAARELATGGGLDLDESGDKAKGEEDEKKNRAAEQAEKEHQRFLERLQERVQAIEEGNMTEIELANSKYAADLELLQLALENELLTRQEFERMVQESAMSHEEKLTDIRKRGEEARKKVSQTSWQQQARTVTQSLMNISNSMETESKKGFEMQKKAGIANALINTYQAAIGAYNSLASIPYVGPALGAAAAIAATAFGMAQVNAIKSSSFTGGGGAGASAGSAGGDTASASSGGGGGGAPGSAPAGQTLAVTGMDPDQLFSGQMVRAFAERLVEHQRDGGTVIFA